MKLCSLQQCTGCLACKNVCKREAIYVGEDGSHGFYPVINKESCVDCGACISVCPIINPPPKKDILNVYIAKSTSDNVINSSSGGIAYEISKTILENGGTVYAAQLFESKLRHKKITTINELELTRGSKYIQSYTGEIFKEIEEDLKKHNMVLFIGVGCQTAAIKNFFRYKQNEKLFIIDLICHGTPSNFCFTNYVNGLLKGKRYNNISFRKGKRLQLEIKDNDNCIYKENFYKDPFYLAFELGKNLRECCYQCPFATKDRVGDITLGDYHSLKKTSQLYDSIIGASMCCINSEKGQYLFDMIKDNIQFETGNLEYALEHNPQLSHPTICPSSGRIPSSYLEQHDIYHILKSQMRKDVYIYTIKNKLASLKKSCIKHKSQV